MVLSSYSHNGITGIGKVNSFSVHPMEHALSAFDPKITHGAGVGVCYLGWAKMFVDDPQLQQKLARLGRYLFEIDDEDDRKVAIMGIARMESFFKTIGMPTTLREFGIKEENLERLADLATGNGTRVVGFTPRPLDREDVLAVYRNCF